MPVYDYLCTNCQKSFTVQASMSAPEPSSGPECSGEHCTIRKQMVPVFAQIAGQHRAPAAPRPTESKPASSHHVCSKYCDLHK